MFIKYFYNPFSFVSGECHNYHKISFPEENTVFYVSINYFIIFNCNNFLFLNTINYFF